MSKVTTLHGMFNDCSSLMNLNINEWDVGNVTSLYYTFYNCSSLTELDVSNWNVINVSIMYNMFFGCSSLTNLNINNWNINNTTHMEYMFTLSPAISHNYDDVLNAWSLLDVQEDVKFDAGLAKYSSSGEASRNYLINTYNWTITDGGMV